MNTTKNYTVEIYDKKENIFSKKYFSNSDEADKYLSEEMMKVITRSSPMDVKISFDRSILKYDMIAFNIADVRFILNNFENNITP